MKLTLFSTLLLFIFQSSLSANTNSELNWAGCGISKKAYMTALVTEYKKDKGITINLQGGGATKGIRKVAAKEVDIGGSCRYFLPDNNNEKFLSFEPVAWDALAVIVHKNNPVSNITLDHIRAVYDGKITNWSQLGGDNAPIELYTRKGKISGVGRSIRRLIFSDYDKEFAGSFKQVKSSGPLEKAIETSINGMAITGISSARLRNVQILKLDDIFPDYQTIRRGKYALYRPLYIVYKHSSPKIRKIRQFIKYAHSKKGRAIMKKNGVVPYLEALHLIVNQMDQDREASK